MATTEEASTCTRRRSSPYERGSARTTAGDGGPASGPSCSGGRAGPAGRRASEGHGRTTVRQRPRYRGRRCRTPGWHCPDRRPPCRIRGRHAPGHYGSRSAEHHRRNLRPVARQDRGTARARRKPFEGLLITAYGIAQLACGYRVAIGKGHDRAIEIAVQGVGHQVSAQHRAVEWRRHGRPSRTRPRWRAPAIMHKPMRIKFKSARHPGFECATGYSADQCAR